jgi:hypothetical protein
MLLILDLRPENIALNMFTDKIGKREDVVPHIDLKGIFTLGWGVVPDKGSVTIVLNAKGNINDGAK